MRGWYAPRVCDLRINKYPLPPPPTRQNLKIAHASRSHMFTRRGYSVCHINVEFTHTITRIHFYSCVHVYRRTARARYQPRRPTIYTCTNASYHNGRRTALLIGRGKFPRMCLSAAGSEFSHFKRVPAPELDADVAESYRERVREGGNKISGKSHNFYTLVLALKRP